MNPTSLHVTLAHAIAYLRRPLLISPYPTTAIIKLQLMLEANLTALYATTWDPRQPFRGSGRCCLTLSPNCLPPLAIYSVCLSSGVQWLHWITLLGFREFNFFVDLASVSLRYATELLLRLVDMARSFALGKWILFATMAGFDEDHLRRCIVYNLSNVCISTSISR